MSFQEFWKNQLEETRKNKKKIIVPEKGKVIGGFDEHSPYSRDNSGRTIIKPGDVNSSGRY